MRTAAVDTASAHIFRKRFESLVDCSIQGILVHRNRRVIFANGTAAKMFGFRSPNQLLGVGSYELVDPQDRPRLREYGHARRAGHPAPDHYEFRGVHQGGRPVWLETRVDRIDWDGAPAVLATVVDITYRKLAEQSLRESEERFRNLVEGSVEGINVVRDGKVVFVNQAFAEMFGYRNPEEVLQRREWWRFQAPHERQRMGRNAKNRLKGRPAPPRYEFQALRKDGALIWLQASVRRIDWHGRPALQGTLVDVTERKLAEAELRASRALLRTVIDTIPHAVFAKDRKGRFLIANRGISRISGRPPQAMIGHTDAEMAPQPAAQAAFYRRTDRQVLRTGKPLHIPEVPIRDAAGRMRHRAVHKLPLRDETGAVVGVVGVSEDITPRREAEEAGAAQRRLLTAVLDAIPYPLSFKDKDGRFRVVNRAFTEAWRRPAAFFEGRRIADLPGLRGAVAAQLHEADLRTLRKGQRVDLPAMTTGTGAMERIRHIVKIPVKEPNGTVSGLISLSEDITQRKRAEEGLVAAKRLLDQILANIPVGLSLVDKDLRVVASNDRFFDLLGFPQSMRGKTLGFADFVRHNAERGEYGPGDVETLVAERVALARKFQPHRFERVRPGGPALDITGNPLPEGGFITTYVDITARRRTEEELRASQRLLQTVLDSLPHALTVKDAKGRYTLVNLAFSEFWHQPREAFTGKRPRELAFIPPSYAAEIDQSDRPVLASGTAVERLTREVSLGGQRLFQRVIKVPVRGDEGGLEGVVSMIEDITERRQAEEELRANRRLLQTVFDMIPINLFVKNMESRFIMANAAQCVFYGLSPGQFQGLATQDLPKMTSTVLAMTRANDRQVLERGQVTPVAEYERENAAGEVRWLRGMKLPLLDDDGRVVGLVGMAEDVTDRRQAQEALEASQRLLRTVIDAIPVNLFVKDTEFRFQLVNRSQAALYGMAPEDLIGNTAAVMPSRTPEQYAEIEAWDRRVLTGGVREEIPVMVRSDRDGNDFFLHGVKVPLLDSRGQVIGLIGMTQDITEQRRADRIVRESEQRMRVLLENAPIIIYSLNREGVFTLSEGKELANMRRMPGEVVGQSAFEVFAHLPARVAQLRRGLAGEAFSEETFIDDQWYDSRHEPIRDADGIVTGLVVVSTNITQRHFAEQEAQTGRRLLKTVFDTIPHSLWVKDTQSRFLMVNHAQARFYGLQPRDMIGMTPADLPNTPPALARAWFDEDREVVERGRGVETTRVVVPLLGGGEGIFHITKLPLRDEHGDVEGVVGLAEDITQRVEAVEALRASQRLLQALFDTIPHRLWVKDTQGNYLLVNHAQARFYGLTPDQMAGMPTHRLPGMTVAQIAQLAEQDRRVVEDGEAVDEPEMEFPTEAGNPGWMRMIKLPLRNEAGEVIGAVGLAEDITERKRAELEARAGRRMLEAVFDTIPLFLSVKDVHGQFLMTNSAGARFEGLSPERFQGMHTEDLPHRTPDEIREILEHDRTVIEGGQVMDFGEYSRLDGAGRLRWLRGRKLPLRDEQGRVTGLLGVVEDVTAHKQALEQLHASRHLLQTVFDALPLRVAVRDAQGCYVLVNRRMADDHAQPAEDFVGKRFWDRPPPPDAVQALILERAREAERTGQPVITPELAIDLQGGERRLLRSAIVPLYGGDGTFQGTLGIGEDITERKKSEQALLQSQKLESLGVLAGGIAHDFNNLLVTIMGNASLAMLKLPPDAPPMEELRQIEMAGQRAADLCRQMLSYAGRGRMEKQPVNLNQLVQEMTQLVRVSLPKGVAIHFRLAQELALTEADATQMRQVIMNLVINAGEAIGEQAGTIAISSGVTDLTPAELAEAHADPNTRGGRYVLLEVTDTGVGMDAATRARIFDPFFTTKFAGRGLGLASVLGIVRGHQGGLKVYSELGKGTSFRVYLPALGDVPATPEPGPPEDPWTGSGVVLVIDDEQAIRSVAVRMLQRLGFQTLEAASGAEALTLVRNASPPLTAALLDLTMPGLSGEETLRQLRRIDGRLPVVLMSGYNERDVLERFVGREPAGFLQKPFKLEVLRDKLRELFQAPAEAGSGPTAS